MDFRTRIMTRSHIFVPRIQKRSLVGEIPIVKYCTRLQVPDNITSAISFSLRLSYGSQLISLSDEPLLISKIIDPGQHTAVV